MSDICLPLSRERLSLLIDAVIKASKDPEFRRRRLDYEFLLSYLREVASEE